MRWDGWGNPAAAKELPFAVRALLPLLLGRIRRPDPGVTLDDVLLPPPALARGDVDALIAVVGDDNVEGHTGRGSVTRAGARRRICSGAGRGASRT